MDSLAAELPGKPKRVYIPWNKKKKIQYLIHGKWSRNGQHILGAFPYRSLFSITLFPGRQNEVTVYAPYHPPDWIGMDTCFGVRKPIGQLTANQILALERMPSTPSQNTVSSDQTRCKSNWIRKRSDEWDRNKRMKPPKRNEWGRYQSQSPKPSQWSSAESNFLFKELCKGAFYSIMIIITSPYFSF